MSKEANTTTGRIINGYNCVAVGLMPATREGNGKNEQIGDVIAVRIKKGERNEIKSLAAVLKATTDLISGTVFEKFTKRVIKDRAAALRLANEFSERAEIPLMEVEAAEFAALPKDEPKKSDKPKTAKKGLVARMSELVDGAPTAEAINALAAVAEGHAPDGSLMAALAALLREAAQHPEITTAEIERAIREGRGIAEAVNGAIAEQIKNGKPKA